MKYVAERGYTDVQLDRHVEEGAVLEEEYKKDNVELTEERINYLVNERKLYKSVEEVPEGKIGDITPVDIIPEGATVVDEVVIVENNNEGKEKDLEDAAVDSNKEITNEVEETNEESDTEGESTEANEETSNEVEAEPEAIEEEKENNNKKNNAKATSKTSTKKEEK